MGGGADNNEVLEALKYLAKELLFHSNDGRFH